MSNFSVKRPAYQMKANSKENGEITMYGEIVESVPVDWWTGEPIAGDWIVQSEFLNDLNELVKSGVKNLTLRMNSLGGDAGVSIVIHNRLREVQADGLNVTCIVDGVAMSGGSLIMSACDKVRVNPSSLVMIHKCWGLYIGAYNADDLRKAAESQDAYDRAQCSIYTRKTGLSDTKVMHMMSETTYMTGKEAVEKGFADEMIEEAEPVALAASADRRALFVGGHMLHLANGMTAPDAIPVSAAKAEDIDENVGSDTDSEEGGEIQMATNLEELRAENPELAAEVESEVRAAVSAEIDARINAAVEQERGRLAEIDEIAPLYDDETVSAAKYGDTACSAQEMAFRAAQTAARTGSAFMAGVMADNSASCANTVPGATAPEDVAEEQDVETEAKKAVEEHRRIKGGNK